MGNRNLTLPDTDKYTAYTIGRVTLKITDNKFEATEMGVPISGSVSYEGKKARLQIEKLMLLPLARDAAKDHPDIDVTPQPDGTLLYDNPRAVDHKPLALKRQTK
jgi:hypothetical protein